MRTKYIVHLAIRDGTTESLVVYAESPQHAIKKAKSRVPRDHVVTRATATEYDQPSNVEELE